MLVRDDGPDSQRIRYDLGGDSLTTLRALLLLLQERRGVGRDMLDWECEDWVSAGYPCRMWQRAEDKGLEFGAESLWCVELLPNIEARLK